MKLTHKQKVKLASRMRSNKEIKDGVGIFDSEAWTSRRESRTKKQIKKK